MQHIKTVAAILLAAGAILIVIGGYRILANLPISEDAAVREAERKLAGKRDFTGNPMNRSLLGVMQIKDAQWSAQSKNQARARERGEAMSLFIPGIVLAVVGGAIFKKNHYERPVPIGELTCPTCLNCGKEYTGDSIPKYCEDCDSLVL